MWRNSVVLGQTMRMGMDMLSSVCVVNWECLAGDSGLNLSVGGSAVQPHSSMLPLEICASRTGNPFITQARDDYIWKASVRYRPSSHFLLPSPLAH